MMIDVRKRRRNIFGFIAKPEIFVFNLRKLLEKRQGGEVGFKFQVEFALLIEIFSLHQIVVKESVNQWEGFSNLFQLEH